MHLRVQILPGTEDPLFSVCPVLSGFLHLQKVSVPHPQQLFCTRQQSICMKKVLLYNRRNPLYNSTFFLQKG